MAADGVRLELWGGIESTTVRVGDRVRDQLVETGHRDRPDDLDRVAALGIRVLRYPILWEAVSPDRPGQRDFAWHDARMARLRALGIRPVAGLLHHGSGPRYTNLLDPAFPRLFARHAAAVASRYPDIDLYTPVNEPLTTARFSCLYGHWFPHERSYGAFLRAVMIQCRATLLAMRAIRRVNPAARLVATDDLGRTFSTPDLAYQAEHENERRWLAFDLLFGRVDRHHPWRRILHDHGIEAREIDSFRDGEAVPDVVGVNHYLTSERFLDTRLGRYPEHLWGGNGRDRYADVEAVRVPHPEGVLGPKARLREAWERYRRPIVVSEVHHGSSRDEQLRWMAEVWGAARALRRDGADIRAVTMWSLFGTVDWNNLLTRETRIYEPGAYDVRGPEPRPTALAAAARALGGTGRLSHPILDVPGWWRRSGRFYRGGDGPGGSGSRRSPRPILVIGGETPLADAFRRIAEARGLPVVRASAGAPRGTGRAWAVLDLSAGADGLDDRARLAAACAARSIPYAAVSSDPAFDGRLGRPAVETDPVSPDRPASRVGTRLAEACSHALLVRTGPTFGPWDTDGLVATILRRLADGGRTDRVSPDIVSPTYLPDLAHVVLDLLIDGESGIRHLANPGAVTASALADDLARRTGRPSPRGAGAASRGRDLSLGTVRGVLMPPLESALERCLADGPAKWREPGSFSRIAAE